MANVITPTSSVRAVHLLKPVFSFGFRNYLSVWRREEKCHFSNWTHDRCWFFFKGIFARTLTALFYCELNLSRTHDAKVRQQKEGKLDIISSTYSFYSREHLHCVLDVLMIINKTKNVVNDLRNNATCFFFITFLLEREIARDALILNRQPSNRRVKYTRTQQTKPTWPVVPCRHELMLAGRAAMDQMAMA